MKTYHQLICLGLVCIMTGLGAAATLVVKDDGTGDYTKVQDAIDAAVSYDTIVVYDGYYYENITLKSPLNLPG